MLAGLGYDTGIDLRPLMETSRWLAGHLARPSPFRVVRTLPRPTTAAAHDPDRPARSSARTRSGVRVLLEQHFPM